MCEFCGDGPVCCVCERDDTEADYSGITLPDGYEWYEELGGQRTGFVADVDGLGWWHVDELGMQPALTGRE